MARDEEIREIVAGVVDGLLGATAEDEPVSGAGDAGPVPASSTATVAVGADHGGFALKERLVALLRREGHTVADCGTFSAEACDYPDFAHEVARRVSEGLCRWGVIVDGAGIGSAMVANKLPGVRAALCYDLSSAANSREHNHANVLTLGAGMVGPALAEQILLTWLATPWGPGRHARRVEKITAVEARYLGPPAGRAG